MCLCGHYRSNFLRKINKVLGIDNEDEVENLQDGIQILGKEGTYHITIQVHEKYASRPAALKKHVLSSICNII